MDPFLKWAGGKRWLRSAEQLNGLQIEGRYIEPFLGSGAIFFSLEPEKAILSDINKDLIDTFLAIRDRPKLVRRYLADFAVHHSEKFYYVTRSKTFSSIYRRAAQFIYLNRTCWNGLYRVNRKGEFNVPKGSKDRVHLATDDFQRYSKLLSGISINCQDFERTVDQANSGDLIYCDPPYTIHHNENGFLKYNENIFTWEDQLRLKAALSRAKQRGARIVVSNAGHKSVIDLYQDFGQMFQLDRSSVISGLNKGRGRYPELLLVN